MRRFTDVKRDLQLLEYQSLVLDTERLRRAISALTPYRTVNSKAEPDQTGEGLPQFIERFRKDAKTVLDKRGAVFSAVARQEDQSTLSSLRLETSAALGSCLSVVRTRPHC